MNNFQKYIQRVLDTRAERIDADHNEALRLFSGFYEGFPDLIVDLYGQTLVLFNYGESGDILDAAQNFLLEKLPWISCVIQKERDNPDASLRRGRVTFGETPTDRISEHGIWYALDLLMNQDASFYLDTRGLRKWMLDHAAGRRVLNTFAYTGSLGVAALAGGADYVLQTDLKRKFLELARRSAMLNRLDLGKMKTQTNDFFSQVAQLKRKGELFDCVILDPPFFSTTQKGSIDLANESTRLINKVRPLVADGGYLVAINNALFLSGKEYLASLEALCADGYLSIETLIPIPEDSTGFPDTIINTPPTDPAPFNHPTKIAIIRIRRK
ncbi:MAG: class I SAM-dependent methyltransferase [Chloroflexi bacterium]|nr:class I SAM-dependent methyltransferase [Chloroflexota bacterium]